MSNKVKAGEKQTGAAKVSRIPVKVEPTVNPSRKPPWIRVRVPVGGAVERIKSQLRAGHLHTVCEEATCPNLGECFSHGTATFMILGDICTRRCPFCDVAHGKPLPVDTTEPANLADTAAAMGLRYVVVTSVDRDDLRDGGAGHFAACVGALRERIPGIKVEILVPDFRGRMEIALDALHASPPDVFNHNMENVPRLYAQIRPGADYLWSLKLIQAHKARHPDVVTKSGLMVGLGEELDEVKQTLRDLRAHDCDMVTIGQYLQPTRHHLPVSRYVTPEEFDLLGAFATELGFSNVASGPLVRSSYHADLQASQIVGKK
jgi:lipoic acid synthetase